MAFVLRSFSAKHLLLLSTIASIATPPIAPLHATYQGYSASIINMAACGVRVSKLIDKMNKYKDAQNLDKLVDSMLDLKSEAEYATGKAISFNQFFDYAQNEMKARGKKISKGQMEGIKKFFKKKEAKHSHKILFMAECISMGVEYDAELEQLAFEAKHEDLKDPGIVPPLGLSIGIACCVCGGVLMMLPIPFSKNVGAGVLTFGVEQIYQELVLNPALEQDKQNRMLLPFL